MGDIKPGWYQDPNDSSEMRFWDGQKWTDKTQKISAVANNSNKPETNYEPQTSKTPEKNSVNSPSKEELKAENARIKEARAQESALQKKAKEQERAANEQALLEKHGRKVYGALIQDGILLRRVSIYEKGFAKIGSSFEKLLNASGQTFVNKKTGIGRSVGTLATFATPFPGFNLLSPGQRGKITLTLVTDKRTHNFSTDQVHNSAVRDYESLLAAAQAVMAQSSLKSQQTHEPEVSKTNLAEQLKGLSELHSQGVLSDDEFKLAKIKIIESM